MSPFCVETADVIHSGTKTVELFCGTKSFSKVAGSLGHATFTVDNDPRHRPDLCVNVLALTPAALPTRPTVLWASPPCQAFSIASIGHHWNMDRTPRSERAFFSVCLVEKTLSLIRETGARWWFIENPVGMLRTLPFMRKYLRRTISYCRYGDDRMKPTDIWTNATWWAPKPRCSNGAGCHTAAPRGSKTGTQGIRSSLDRARVPPALFVELFDQMPVLLDEAVDV